MTANSRHSKQTSTAVRKSKVKSQKSKVLYIKARGCLKWLLYLRRAVLVPMCRILNSYTASILLM